MSLDLLSGLVLPPAGAQDWAASLSWMEWMESMGWMAPSLHVAAALACLAIPLALLWAAWRQRQLRMPKEDRGGMINRTLLLLAASLFFCGAGFLFLVGSAAFPEPNVWLDVALHLLIAMALFAAAAALYRLAVQAPRVPTAARLQRLIGQLEHEVEVRTQAERSLHEAQDTLRQLAAHQEQIREEERKRIAREIHDELGQNLMALRLDVTMLQSRVGTRHPILARRVDMVLSNIDTTIRSMRGIMNNLRPAVLDIGLVAAADWQISEFRRSSGVACEFEAEPCDGELDDAQATGVFRILQDALLHAGRHSQITRLHIALRARQGRLLLNVRDNGVGSYPNNRRRASTFILMGMRERAHSLGGELIMEDIKGAGAELRLAIPIRSEAKADVPHMSHMPHSTANTRIDA